MSTILKKENIVKLFKLKIKIIINTTFDQINISLKVVLKANRDSAKTFVVHSDLFDILYESRVQMSTYISLSINAKYLENKKLGHFLVTFFKWVYI